MWGRAQSHGAVEFTAGVWRLSKELQQVCLEAAQWKHPRLAVPHEMGQGKGAQSAPSNHWGHILTGKGRLGVPGNPSAVPTAEVSHK